MLHAEMVNLDHILMDGLQDMVFVVGVNERHEMFYKYINRISMEKTGLTRNCLGKSIYDIYPKEKADFLYSHYFKALTTLEVVTYEDSYHSPEGEKYYSETKLTPLKDEKGRCYQVVAVVHDITGKKRAEFELKEYWNLISEGRQRYRSLFEYSLDAMITLDMDANVLNGNPMVESVTGYSLTELICTSFYTLVDLDNFRESKRFFQIAMDGTPVTYRTTILNNVGHSIELSVKFTPIIINDEVTGVFGILRDVSENINLNRKYKESEDRFKIIAEHAHDLITLLDARGEITYASPSYQTVLGFGDKDYEGNLFSYNVHPDQVQELEDSFIHSITEGVPCKLQFQQKHRTKGWIWFELHGTPVFDDRNRFVHMVVVSRDITLQKEYESKLTHFAFHDSLTDLPNRRYFKKVLTEALEEHQKNQVGLAVMMMDLDNFKWVNDELGHDIGDEVIKEFGRRVQQNIGENDVVARLGGDEFVVLLPNVKSTRQVEAYAQQILQAMQDKWEINDYVLEVSASIGIAIAPLEGASEYSLLKTADESLYEVKETSKNSYVIK
ncbi:hypothetical protein GCM10008967_03670 [Bacillus carboniphilus]|uniref:Diguanylate cyclase n=1 Tax=Bacillus carboniphilus TaxID=86663 RepID=A0ABP3FHN2_9BACI